MMAGSSVKPKPKPVELGFVEEKEGWKLSSAFFASKVGGKPAWLDLRNLPKSRLLHCSACQGPTKFLLQVYAPLDSPSAFHRSLLLFLCPSPQCSAIRNSNGTIIALRSQLRRENDFYSPEPPSYDLGLAEIGPERFGLKLCRLCGVRAEEQCALCKKINYCSKEHQVLDWTGAHKEECSREGECVI